jgi:flagellar biosynthesis protein FlhB
LRRSWPLIALLIASIVGPIALGGWLFSTEALQPKASRMNPLAGLKRMFSVQALVELLKALAKFLVIVESRIYAQLSKQLADAMFAEGSADTGSFDFQGTNISYVKTGTDVTLTITEANGNRTDITVPLSSFAF